MYKIKIFSGEGSALLQQAVNEWLHLNKDILIHNSNLSGSGSIGIAEQHFFILYTSPDEEAHQLKEMAATVTQEQSIDIKEINPEIMKPSS